MGEEVVTKRLLQCIRRSLGREGFSSNFACHEKTNRVWPSPESEEVERKNSYCRFVCKDNTEKPSWRYARAGLNACLQTKKAERTEWYFVKNIMTETLTSGEKCCWATMQYQRVSRVYRRAVSDAYIPKDTWHKKIPWQFWSSPILLMVVLDPS